MVSYLKLVSMTTMVVIVILLVEDAESALPKNPSSSHMSTFRDHKKSSGSNFQRETSDYSLNEELSFRNVLQQSSTFFEYYLPRITSNVSARCAQDLLAIEKALETHETLFTENRWALKLFDSWGKFEDGLLQGNQKFLGFFDECLSVGINGSAVDFGRYCLVSYSEPSPESRQKKRHSIVSHDIHWHPIASYYATCIPSTCTQEELSQSVASVMEEDGFQLDKVQCQSLADDTPFDGSEIFGIVFFSFVGFILLTASLLDVFLTFRKKDSAKRGKAVSCLLAFSVPSNLSQTFNLQTQGGRDVITCMNGMRFLSITWVVMVHQYFYSPYVASNSFGGPTKLSSRFLFQIPLLGDTAVDTFFTVGGFLVSYNFFRSKSKSFSITYYYVHRFIRLAPPIATCVIFFATVAGLTVTGPFAPLYRDVRTEACRQFWWVDWTFFSNFVYRFGSNLVEKTGESFACISQCWYTSVDMQLYLVMPAILLPMLHWKKGIHWLSFWIVASFVIPAAIIGVNDTYPGAIVSTNAERGLQYNHLVYIMPYCRASPYLIGVWAGWLLSTKNVENITLKRYQVIGGWTLATGIGLFVVFGLYPYNQFSPTNPADDLGLAYSVINGGLRRGLWGMCVAWVVVACHMGYGGVVNKFLSYPAFQPLGRITFSIFLVSLPVQYLLFYSTVRPIYYNNITQISEICGVLFFSGIGALMLTLISEIPILKIEKALRSPKQGPKNSPGA